MTSFVSVASMVDEPSDAIVMTFDETSVLFSSSVLLTSLCVVFDFMLVPFVVIYQLNCGFQFCVLL